MSMSKTAIIILDSGFARQSLARVKNLLGYLDLNSGLALTGDPLVQGQALELVLSVAQDKLNHGTIILDRLLEMDADLPFVLVRGFAPEGGLIRTRFEDGRIVSDGWTEAYLWAQDLCARKGYCSVANFSFGGFHHALDGSGWESFQLAKVVGEGKPGHLLAAAAGPGDGRAIHASFTLEPGGETTVRAHQDGTSTYNLWVNRFTAADSGDGEGSALRDFAVEARINGEVALRYRGRDLPANLWNGRQQITFEVHGRGAVEISISLPGVSESVAAARFDIYISREGGDGARFHDHVDSELVCEPAVFSQVIAVGLKRGSYGQCSVLGLNKPEILVEGSGPISFRTPEITFALARMLAENPALDVSAARDELHRRWYQAV